MSTLINNTIFTLTEVFDNLLNIAIKNAIENNNPSFFSKFINLYKSFMNTEEFKSILNDQIYTWYFGNLCHKIASLVSLHEITDEQVSNITYVTYILITQYDLITDIKDYYDETPLNVLKMDSKNNLRPIYLLIKHGKNIEKLHMLGCKQYINNVTTKKKKAVKTIEKYWIEIICDPNTKVGQKMIMKKTESWKILAHN